MMGNDEHDLATHIQRLGNYIHFGNKSKDEKALHPRSSLGTVMKKKTSPRFRTMNLGDDISTSR
ncbi:UNVERIFIED_CONTAM: hypothetical protein NY100_03185 [Prevotella sp. 15_C9]